MVSKSLTRRVHATSSLVSKASFVSLPTAALTNRCATLAQIDPASEKLGSLSLHELPAWWKPVHDTILTHGVGLYGLDAEKIIDEWPSFFQKPLEQAVCVSLCADM